MGAQATPVPRLHPRACLLHSEPDRTARSEPETSAAPDDGTEYRLGGIVRVANMEALSRSVRLLDGTVLQED